MAMPPLRKWIKYGIAALCAIAVILLLRQCTGGGWFSDYRKESSMHHMVVEKIEAMGKLELVRYQLKDVVEEKIERPWWKGGETRVLLIVSGEAVGCVDLKAIREADVKDQGDRLWVTLPEPQLCYARVNHDQSKVYDAPTSFWTNNGEAVDAAYKAAETKMRDAALEMGILTQTRENAVKLLKPLLESISGKPVDLMFREVPAVKN